MTSFRLNHLCEDPISQILGVRASTCGLGGHKSAITEWFLGTLPEPRAVESR